MLDRLRSYFRKNFGFSETEIRGLIVLVPVVITLLFVPRILKSILWEETAVVSPEDQRLLEEWYEEVVNSQAPKSVSVKIKTIHFDPNSLSVQEWLDLGFQEKTATTIFNYRLKGGRFREKEDLFKIYGIDQELVLAYLPYMMIPKEKTIAQRRQKADVTEKTRPTREFKKVNLSMADTIQFKTIKGVGSYWSRRIVNFREALGGFVDEKQLYEIYGIEPQLVDWVLEQSYFEPAQVNQILINQDSIKAISKHPYISYRTARAIVAYRQQHGDYADVDDLKQLVSIPDSVLTKISPYLKVSD